MCVCEMSHLIALPRTVAYVQCLGTLALNHFYIARKLRKSVSGFAWKRCTGGHAAVYTLFPTISLSGRRIWLILPEIIE